MTADSLIAVAETDEFETADRKIVEVRGVEVGVVAVNDEYHAFLNSCPHQHGPVAEGSLGRTVVAEPPDIGDRVDEQYDPGKTVIRCPWHSWAFDVETGTHVGASDAGYDLVTYETIVKDGTIYLKL